MRHRIEGVTRVLQVLVQPSAFLSYKLLLAVPDGFTDYMPGLSQHCCLLAGAFLVLLLGHGFHYRFIGAYLLVSSPGSGLAGGFLVLWVPG